MQALQLNLQIHYGQRGIQCVRLQPTLTKGIHCSFYTQAPDPDLEAQVSDWLEAYQQKKLASIDLPFDWQSVPVFTQQVLQFVAKIPLGHFSTYGAIAALLDRPKAARAVGRACGRNPFVLFIPCHRVLDGQHQLRGYSAGGVAVKQAFLDFEKI